MPLILPTSFFLQPAIFLCMALASPTRQRPPGRTHYIHCPRCEAGSELVALESIRFEQGPNEVTVHDGVVETSERLPVAEPDPRLEMQFKCFAGHHFTRRLRATSTGKVALTAQVQEN